jgi:outer membrane protein OmpA-like peptidoglycan-associated protein
MRNRILGLCLLLASNSHSQWQKVAQPYQDKMNYYSAAKAYKKVLDTGNAEDFLRYTRVLYHQGQYRESYENLKYLAERNQVKTPEDLQAFRTCKSILEPIALGDFDSQFGSLFTQAKIKGFEASLPIVPRQYDIQNACFNSDEYEDLCPFSFGDKILFTSSRPSVNADLGEYSYNNQPFYDVFAVKECDVQSLNRLRNELPKNINTYLHDGPAYYAGKSDLFFVTRNIEVLRGTMPMGIFYSVRKDGKWSRFEALPVNNKKYTVQHPYFDDSTQTLYFSSNMDGGLGGFDLYAMKYLNGTWAEPINIGASVNTSLNEVFPYMYKGNLYFSSNGYKGMGGLDLYMANAGGVYDMAPLNSAWDDYGLLFVSDSVGYISSNRINGFAKDDILRFNLKYQGEELIVKAYAKGDAWGEAQQTNIKVLVRDEQSGLPIETPQVQLLIINKKSGLRTNFVASQDSINALLGHFKNDSLFDIQIKVSHPNYFPVSITKNDLNAAGGELDLGTVNMKSNGKGSKYPELKPIYFDLDKFYIRNDAARTLDSIVMVLNEYPTIKLKLRSFTDSRASDRYNDRLSENRAKSTFKYLTQKGINPNRLLYGGYGESNLVNDCGNDKECEEHYHQMNRRTEFEIIEK